MNNSKMRCSVCVYTNIYIYISVPVADLHMQKSEGEREMEPKCVLYFSFADFLSLPYKVNNLFVGNFCFWEGLAEGVPHIDRYIPAHSFCFFIL